MVSNRAQASGARLLPLRGLFVVVGACLGAQPVLGQEPALGLHAGSDFSLTQYDAFGEWLGRDVMYRVVFLDKRSWTLLANGALISVSKAWVNSKPGRVEVISVPLLPDGDNGRFADIIAGTHDDVFQSLATRIRNAAIASQVIIRLGWEGNSDWYPWSYLRDPAGYRAAFRRVVAVMRAIAPELRFDFNISNLAARGTDGAKWTDGYPGDDVVAVISTDVYDQFHGWTDMMTGDAGLYELREFAKAHNKPEAFAEWACSVTSNGHGDNAGFVRAMAAWIAARPGKVLYQSYWNSSEGVGALLQSATQDLLPNTAATYRRIFGPNTPPTITAIPDQVITVNGSAGPLGFSIDDGQTPVERLGLIVNVSNPALLPLSRILISGQWNTRTLTLAPVSNCTGWSTVWLKVSDGTTSCVTSFVVNVIAQLAFADVGAPALASASTQSGNTFTLQAGGYDIYNRRDEMRFGEVELTGDCELTVRVASLTPTHPWTKAGLMLRSSSAEDAANVAVFVTSSRGVVMQWRKLQGGGTASSVPITGAAPAWLRLIRSGDVFLAFCSSDGKSWEFVDETEVVLPATAQAGLALTSHDPHLLATAVFDYLNID